MLVDAARGRHVLPVLHCLGAGQLQRPARIADRVAAAVPSLAAQGAATVSDMSAKFTEESERLLTLAEPSVFFCGLQQLTGPPNMINGSIYGVRQPNPPCVQYRRIRSCAHRCHGGGALPLCRLGSRVPLAEEADNERQRVGAGD